MKRTALFILFCLIGTDAYACGCDKPRTPADVEWKKPGVIFEGTVESVVTQSDEHVKTQYVTFLITKMHRGSRIEHISVKFSVGGNSCELEPLNFEAGQSFLISASDPYATSDASRNRTAEDASIGQYSSNYCDLREPLGQEWPN